MKPEVAITFLPPEDRESRDAIVDAAVRMDQDGLVFGAFDDYPFPRPYDLLLAIAQRTEVAKIATVGIAIPREDQKLTAPLDFIRQVNATRPGRAILGMVPGAWMDQLGKKPATLGEIENAANTIRAGLGENAGEVPLLLGAWGPKMAALAGRIFDQFKIGGSANPMMIQEMRKRIEIGSDEAGRRELPKISIGATTVVDLDKEVARRDAKRRAAMYIAVIGKNDPFAMEKFGKEIDAITKAVNENNYETAIKHMSDELADMFIIAGTPDDIVKHSMRLYRAGADRVEFGSPHGVGQGIEAEIRGLDLMRNAVVPALIQELGRNLI